MMAREKTSQNSESAGLASGGKAFPLVRRGPVIMISAEAGNIGSPARLIDITRDISARLDAVEIGYMLTGSMALNCYALPCVPRNLDFVLTLRPNDAEVMVRLFSPDYDLNRAAVDHAMAEETAFQIVHRKSRTKVNCIVCRPIKYRLNEFNRRQRLPLDNFKTWVVSKEDLIVSKLHWARKSRSSRQLRDVKNLAATGCDRAYVDFWTQALGVFGLWQECSSE